MFFDGSQTEKRVSYRGVIGRVRMVRYTPSLGFVQSFATRNALPSEKKAPSISIWGWRGSIFPVAPDGSELVQFRWAGRGRAARWDPRDVQLFRDFSVVQAKANIPIYE